MATPAIMARALVLGALLSGCGSAIVPVESARSVQELPPPPAIPPEYLLQAGDTLDMKLLDNPELNEQVLVRPDGRVSLPMAPELMAGGRTVAALRDDVTTAYGRDLVSPRVSLILRSFIGARVYVGGEVNQPGELVVVGKASLLQAAFRAGGFKNGARLDKVVLIRRGNVGIGYYVANLEQALEGSDTSGDVELAPYDIVYVPRSGIYNVASFFQEVIRPILPVGFTLAYPLR